MSIKRNSYPLGLWLALASKTKLIAMTAMPAIRLQIQGQTLVDSEINETGNIPLAHH